MQLRDRTRIADMIEAAEKVQRFIADPRRQDLDDDDMLQFACVRGIEIIGEAAANVSAEMRDVHPEIPWRNIIGMRNRIVHGYADLDLEVVWQTASNELPQLLAALRRIEIDP